MKKSVRYYAIKALDTMEEGVFISDAIDAQIISSSLEKSDAGFLTLLVKSAYENLLAIDFILGRHSNRELGTLDMTVKSALRIGATEILVLNKKANYATLNEVVEAVKQLGYEKVSGFVNAILRNLIRAGESLDKLKSSTLKDMSIKYSIPLWILKLLEKDYGRETTRKIATNKENAEFTSYRIINNDEEVKAGLLNRYPESKISQIANNSIMLKNAGSPLGIEEFSKGLITASDPASTLVGNIAKQVMSKSKSPLILDLCAAPGGKALHMAEIEQSQVLACDISKKKLKKIKENIDRIGITNVKLYLNDAKVLNEQLVGRFDLVLCDLPCSGLGLINRKPDLRYRLKPEDIGQLASLQKDILKNAITYLKPNGILIFSTCTLSAEENKKNYLYLRQRLKPIALKQKDYLQLIQGIDKSDGFFISVFMK